MKSNPQNIEVGDVVTFRNTTSIVLEVTINNSTGNCSITVYFNGNSHKVDVQVEDVRIVRKWDGSIPSESKHLNTESCVTEVTKQKMLSAKHCGRCHVNE